MEYTVELENKLFSGLLMMFANTFNTIEPDSQGFLTHINVRSFRFKLFASFLTRCFIYIIIR